MIKVSVIIPIYNVESYLRTCLASVGNQTLQDIEIICVDDCGSDNSMSIAYEFAKNDPRFIILKHDKNKGLGAARNTGIRVARGEYLGFIDSDDFISIDFFEKLYSSARNHDAEIAQSAITLVYESNGSHAPYHLNSEIKKLDSSTGELNHLAIYYGSGMCWNKIYKKSLIQKNSLFFPEGVYWEDNPFVVRAAYYAKSIVPVIDVHYMYRQREGSIIKLTNQKLHLDLLATHEDIIDFINSIRVSKFEYLNFLYHVMSRLIYEKIKIKRNNLPASFKHIYSQRIKEIFARCKYNKEFNTKFPRLTAQLQMAPLEYQFWRILESLKIVYFSIILLTKILIYSPRLLYRLAKTYGPVLEN